MVPASASASKFILLLFKIMNEVITNRKGTQVRDIWHGQDHTTKFYRVTGGTQNKGSPTLNWWISTTKNLVSVKPRMPGRGHHSNCFNVKVRSPCAKPGSKSQQRVVADPGIKYLEQRKAFRKPKSGFGY